MYSIMIKMFQTFEVFRTPIFKCFLKCFVPPKLMYENVLYPLSETREMFHTPVKNTPAGYAG